jgi:gluconate kinase
LTKLILINGAPGIGKTTVGELVFARLSDCAFLDGDDVWRISPFEVTERTKAIVIRNIPFVLRGYIEAGYEHVLLTWVLHQPAIIEQVLKGLRGLCFELHIFTLVADEVALLDRWRTRAGRWEVPELVVERLRESLKLPTTKIDTSSLTADEIADRIIASLASAA